MKFRFYDILSQLIPGFILYTVLLKVSGIQFDSINILPATGIAFILGYFLNTMASWFEPVLFATWGGKPSDLLLMGKNIWMVPFFQSERALSLLNSEVKKEQPEYNELFEVAMRYANAVNSQRVSDFNALYAFSRVILMTVLVVSVILATEYYYNVWFYAAAVVLLFISWLRCKQRGGYYAREVLNSYLHAKRIDSEED